MKIAKVGLAMITAALFGACSDTNGPGNNQGNENVSLSFSTYRPGTVGAVSPFSGSVFGIMSDTLRSGADVLILDRAQIVLREIELKRQEIVDCDVEPEPEGCEELEVGPVLVDLPLNGATAQSVSIPIDPGTYDEIEFELHKLDDDDPADQAFAAANPNFAENSVRVEGTFNGQAFVYTSDVNVEQEFDLVPPLVVDTAEVTSNVTVRVDMSMWFVDATGSLIDPASANKGEVNEGVVVENIKQSIEAFEDDDSDGDDEDEDNDNDD